MPRIPHNKEPIGRLRGPMYLNQFPFDEERATEAAAYLISKQGVSLHVTLPV